MSKIFISVINFNKEELTHSLLDSLENVSTSGFSLNVVVVDNNSQIPFKLKKQYKNFKTDVVLSEKNLGFSGGQNLGIKFALKNEADFVIILNNDVLVDKNFIVNMLSFFSDIKDCGIVSPKIYFAKGYEFHKDRYEDKELGKVIWYAGGLMDFKNIIGSHRGVDEVDKGQFESFAKTDFASGCCMMIKKEVFEKVGLFDEKYFLYYEDNDFCQRAKNKGFFSYYQPKAFIWHLNAGSTGGSGSSLHDYFITRNRLIFGYKYAGLKTKLALFRESLKILLIGRPSQKNGIIDFYTRKLGKGSFINE